MPEEVKEIVFEATDSFEIANRGTVFTGPSPIDINTQTDIIGKVIRVKDKLYKVKGVEHFLSLGQIASKGEPAGFLVESQ